VNVNVNLTCDELRALIGDHHDGELQVEKRESFQLHLKGCQDCGFYLESYTHTVKVVKKLPSCGPLPAAVEARLREAIRQRCGPDAP
jgi:hypothetical protein